MTRGEKLRQARERAGKTDWQLARDMWIGPRFIRDVEAGKQQMGDALAGWAEKILGLEPGALAADKD